LAQRFGLDDSERGIIVSEATGDAAEAGIRTGDIIKEANKQKIQNVRDYNQIVQKLKKGDSLLLLVKRGQHTFYVPLKNSGQ
ncbi:MAG: PDZ domain-containing protein, partial [Acidobacteriota bacterium]